MTLTDITRLTGAKSRTTVLRWIAERGFPAPVTLGGRGHPSTWSRAAVEAWWRDNQHKTGRHPR